MFENHKIRQVLDTDIRVPIPPALVAKITSLPPFIPIQGVPNFRDLSHDGNKLRPGFVYRSGSLSGIWGAGKSIITTELGITTIFDLRNENERQKSPSPSITGVKTIWRPYGARPATLGLLDFVGEDKGATGFVKMYNGVLEAAAPCFTEIFKHIRDNPEDPFIAHCSAGKDRTGVLAALILLLINRPHDDIINDYILSRVTLESARENLMEAFAVNLGADGLDISQLSPEALGMLELCGVRASSMEAFLLSFENTYRNGIEGYLIDTLGFSSSDLSTMRRNLT
ncbi:Protein-tyrosine/Dual-specificity phosphatase [Penicillium cf. griseofulvum]|uniref:Protein-tyrosine/Dual-specificity phosphatase n=1 Tax=Penicillium cf. griseofulvum TaxID=2972120 RepID=A0A9W9J2J7_9EURO|nr:Protein-tyrosine/Dual-specificity phosphatase [Penicillium cf. griseofulvum]KAJ5435184.1 Protein-tyrosine/Dual-specificity phosphatase [Penicillium cf. griseofulvum]KAJ5453016.1 Protein-tyrosine/Dual-specificity phosphatase [Penicillium cf. griseofulvum]